MPMRVTILGLTVAVLALSACSNGVPTLMNLRNTESGPDEFSVVPTRELEMPSSRDLPAPTPGGINRADPNPEADAIAALGGNINAAPSAGGLVTYAGRFGVASDIRGTLAAEDEQFRRENDGRLLERLFRNNVYFDAYEDQSLDRYAELERLRRMGVQTPSAPPPE
ncbi:DUF3035 domain-containing protein [Gymnodinialimonas hymeniacidonis]|uniref:DUF3035 domain-containing protein n=1 Tax=Gymnodinialimonas hymeniacidonis TaxID=3126508 RepID=UPI0034C6B8F5